MTLLGWLFLVVSVGGVWALTIWCFTRVLSFPDEPPEAVEHFHSA
jgi:hypothetical protein